MITALLLLIVAPIFALDNTISVCTSNSILQVNVTQEINNTGNVSTIKVTENVFCPYGCNSATNECLGLAENTDFGIVAVIALIAICFIFAAIALMTKDNHAFISFIFFFMIQIAAFILVGTTTQVLRDAGKTAMANGIEGLLLPIGIFFFVTLTYFVIVFFKAVAVWLVKRKVEKEKRIVGL